MESLLPISKLIGFSAVLLFLVKWVLDGGYFNIRIHKYDTKINIVTKLMENEHMSGKGDIKSICNEIIQSSLFGIEYICDCNGMQLQTLKNMVGNGLTKRGVRIASKIIDPSTGKLKQHTAVKYLVGALFFFGVIIYALIAYLLFIKILEEFSFSGYQLHFINQTTENNAANMFYYFVFYLIVFVVFLYQYILITLERRIAILYDSDGNFSKNKQTFFNTYIFWWDWRPIYIAMKSKWVNFARKNKQKINGPFV
jgi:hypothetical protein